MTTEALPPSSPPLAIEQIGRKMSGGPEVGLGIREGEMYSLDRAGAHGVFQPDAQMPFVKAGGARHSDDVETWKEGDVSRTLNSMGQAGTNGAVVAAFTQNQRDEVRDLGDQAASLSAQPGSHQDTRLAMTGAVRRLTPTECERLQAFPDGWTVIPKT